MSFNPGQTAQVKTQRGAILRLIYSRHAQQQSRMDDASLWSLMRALMYDIGQNDVITLLQDLKDRGYVSFEQEKNRWNNQVYIRMIQITAKGRDLVEETISDPAVLI